MSNHNAAIWAIRTLSSDLGYAQVRPAAHSAALVHVLGRMRVTNITRFYKWGDYSIVKACLMLAAARPYSALISPSTLRLRPRKALSTCVLATAVFSAPAHIDPSEGYELANLVVSIAKAHATHATTEDVQLVWAIKNGMRRATVLFGRLSPRDDARNIVTMTSGIRN